jgi:hypothetical protein
VQVFVGVGLKGVGVDEAVGVGTGAGHPSSALFTASRIQSTPTTQICAAQGQASPGQALTGVLPKAMLISVRISSTVTRPSPLQSPTHSGMTEVGVGVGVGGGVPAFSNFWRLVTTISGLSCVKAPASPRPDKLPLATWLQLTVEPLIAIGPASGDPPAQSVGAQVMAPPLQLHSVSPSVWFALVMKPAAWPVTVGSVWSWPRSSIGAESVQKFAGAALQSPPTNWPVAVVLITIAEPGPPEPLKRITGGAPHTGYGGVGGLKAHIAGSALPWESSE